MLSNLSLQLLFLNINLLIVVSKPINHDDICGDLNGRRVYLDLGDHGSLAAKYSDDVSQIRKTHKIASTHRECSLELITCPSCIISVKFTFLNISRNCGRNSVLDSCGCDYIWIYEPPFEQASGEQFCGHFVERNGSSLVYRSQTRSTSISFMYITANNQAFNLEYYSERNIHAIEGYPKEGNLNILNQQISSPFFPNMYPRDLSLEYVINCKTNEKCQIRLIFTDFQLSAASLIEFFDWNGQRLEVATGALFRPPVIISTGPSLVVRFYANGGSNFGYKAIYNFLEGDLDNSTLKSNSNCGGYVDNLGGGITMMNMVEDGTKAYDCFWIIRPPVNYLHLRTHLYLKIVKFQKFAGNTELTIRQGLTSNEPAVEILKHPSSNFFVSKRKEHVVPISQGFYVSLRGLFRPKSSLAIAYAAFSYKGTDFLCHNQRCISAYLSCDGFDHCGDESDEPSNCIKEPRDRRWSLQPNFYFPKIYRYSDLKTATIVFIVCSLGLISLIFALIIILYRVNMKNRTRRNSIQSHIRSINDLLEEDQVREVEITISDDPPIYEAPPDYEEASKEKVAGGFKKQSMARRDKKELRRIILKNMDKIKELSGSDNSNGESLNDSSNLANTSRSSQTTTLSITIPDSPPPTYTSLNIQHVEEEENYHKDEETVSINVPSTSTFFSLDENIHKRNKAVRRSDVKLKKDRLIFFDRTISLSDSEICVKAFPNGSVAFTKCFFKKVQLQRSASIENLCILK